MLRKICRSWVAKKIWFILKNSQYSLQLYRDLWRDICMLGVSLKDYKRKKIRRISIIYNREDSQIKGRMGKLHYQDKQQQMDTYGFYIINKRAKKRQILNVSLKDRIRNQKIGRRTRITDLTDRIARVKWQDEQLKKWKPKRIKLDLEGGAQKCLGEI